MSSDKTSSREATTTPGLYIRQPCGGFYARITLNGKRSCGWWRFLKTDIACWFIDTDYNEESFFVRHGCVLGAKNLYNSLKTSLKAEINPKPGPPSTATPPAPLKNPPAAASQ